MKKRHIHKKPVKPPSPSSCRALVLIDAKRLKDVEQAKCEKIHQKIEFARSAIELHESQSVPAFQAWLSSHFGVQLTKTRELAQKFNELRDLVEAVQLESFYSGQAEWKIYETFMRLKSKREEFDEAGNCFKEAEEKFEEEMKEEFIRSSFEAQFGTKKQWRSKRQSYEEVFEEFKEDLLNEMELDEMDDSDEFCDNPARGSSQFQSPSSKKSEETPLRLKEVYRALARKLHPDLNPNLEPKMIELWHQVSEAYEMCDVSKLETLNALSEMYDHTWERIDSISTLKKLVQELKSSLRQLEKKIREARKTPSWNFHLKQDFEMKIFEREMSKELASGLTEMEYGIQRFQSQIERWENPSKRERRQKRLRRPHAKFVMGSEFEEFEDLF